MERRRWTNMKLIEAEMIPSINKGKHACQRPRTFLRVLGETTLGERSRRFNTDFTKRW